MASQPLKLMAQDEEGLAVISACLQDALCQLRDMRYNRKQRRFFIMFSRYKWEEDGSRRNDGNRVRAGLHFEDVLRVRTQGIAQDDIDGLLDLLAVTAKPAEHGFDITLVLAGGGAVRLEAECVEAYLADVGAEWEAKRRPDHQLDTASDQ